MKFLSGSPAERQAAFRLIVIVLAVCALVHKGFAQNSPREELQRPIDPRLLKIESAGFEASGLFAGKVHRAKSAKEVRALSGKLAPGDQLVLTAGQWNDAHITFAGRGTETAPIIIRPERPGATVFSGGSGAIFEGSHLVISGLEFRNITVTNKGTTILRLGNGTNRPADHCIVHRVTIDNCNSPDPVDWPRVREFYLTVQGRDNTVARSTFSNLRNYGQMLSAQDLPRDGLQRLHILNNRFVNRPFLDHQNGYEIIQIGWSGEKARSAGSLIQGNHFEHCDGENETITLKASDVFVRSNTFTACQGVLCLRETSRVLVEGNVWDGQNRPDTGGVRLQGAGHVIRGNTFRKLGKPRNHYYWTISLMAADVENAGESIGYARAHDIVIAGNRLEHNVTRIAAGIFARPEYPLLPKNICVKGNVFAGGTGSSAFDYRAPDSTGALRKELFEADNQFLP